MTHRILHVITSLEHGGAEHQLVLNLSALDSTRFDSHVCCIQQGGALEHAVTGLGVPVHVLRVSGKPGWPRAVWRIRQLIQEHRIDLVHTLLVEADIIGGLAGRLAKVPVVDTLVNVRYGPEAMVDNPRLTPAKARAMRTVTEWTYRLLHCKHIAISEYVREWAARDLRIPRRKTAVIYRSLPPEWADGASPDARDKLRRELGLEEAYPLLLNVGRLMPQKGQRYLVQAMPEIVKSFPAAHLLIVGKGFSDRELTAMRDHLGLQSNVTFLGTRNDVRNLLEASDLFVFPSLFEGLGVSLVEAAGAGLPTVASDVGPIPEVVRDGDSGVLVAPRSPEALAQAVIQLASDPDRMRAMGEQARRIAGERFDIRKNIRQTEAVYEAVLGVQPLQPVKAFSGAR